MPGRSVDLAAVTSGVAGEDVIVVPLTAACAPAQSRCPGQTAFSPPPTGKSPGYSLCGIILDHELNQAAAVNSLCSTAYRLLQLLAP